MQLLSWEEGEEDLKELHTRVIPFDESAQECTTAGRGARAWFVQIHFTQRYSSKVLEKRLPENACIFFTRNTAVVSDCN